MCQRPLSINDRVVPCGKCDECLSSQRQQWIFRIKEEGRRAKLSRFLTLTYNDENLIFTGNGEATLYKNDLKKYFKRVRKKAKELRFFGVGEYGSENHRPHYHAIVFNVADDILVNAWTNYLGQDSNNQGIYESKGFARVDECNDATIAYCTKYIINNDERDCKKQKPFRLMSKGLGKDYLSLEVQRFYSIRKEGTVINEGGVLGVMPRYFKEKIFTKEESAIIGSKNSKEAEKISKGKTAKQWENEKEFLRKMNNKKSKSNKL